MARWLLLVLLWSLSANAMQQSADQAETEARLEAIAAELQRRQAAIEQRAEKLSLTEQELRLLELQISTVTNELNATRNALRETQARINELQQQQTQLEQRQQQQLQLLARQLDMAYRMGRHDFIKLVLNQEDPARFERLLGYYGYLNRARLAEVEELKTIQSELAQVTADLESQRQTLAQQQQEQRVQQGVVQEQQREQQQLITRLQREQAADKQRINQLKEDQEALERVLDAIIAALRDEPRLEGLQGLKGQLSWPAEGRVQRVFGKPRSGGVTWKGITIEAAAGTPVTAIADGRVLFANWLRGFGLVLVLDHGNGYMSLYGHNQTIIPSVGETVRRNETVALVGQSGGRSEPGLYLEIRAKGDAVNPTQWFR